MTTMPPLEIELKLALPAGQVAAFRKRMARRRAEPVEQNLVTRYFDTPDFALSTAGVALRMRRAGRRWLQTLKTEGERLGGLSRRSEYEMPARSGALDWTLFPPEALACVPAALRAATVPVFETRFHRTAWLLKGRGGAQIEVALDIGEVVAGELSEPICEVELELKAGQPDALFEMALGWAGAFGCLPLDVSKAERGVRLARGTATAPVKSAPAALGRGMNVEDGFAAVVQACLAQFQANLPGVLGLLPPAGEGAKAEPTPINEYVHQARVALRRLRAALRLFRGACVLPDALLAGLRAIAASLGAARDWDVLVDETLPAIAPHYPDADAWQRGLAPIEARRVEVRAAMRSTLLAAQPGAWLLDMQRWMQQRSWRAGAAEALRLAQRAPLDDWACRAQKRGHRHIVRDARVFDTLQPPARHALRIVVKRQRYAAEFFQPLFAGKRQLRYLAALRAAQDSLGRANDIRIARELLASVDATAGPMGDFVRGWLAAQLAADSASESAMQMQAVLDTPASC